MQLVGNMGLDLATVPIGDVFTMGIDDSIEAVKLLRPRQVLPDHYNTWLPIEQDAEVWLKKLKPKPKVNRWSLSQVNRLPFKDVYFVTLAISK